MVWSIIVIILLASADQLLKAVVRSSITPLESIPVIDGFFNLVNRKNPGAAWSFLADQDWGIYVLTAVSGIVTLMMLFIIIRSQNKRLQACLAIISAGSLGNLVDRIRYRAVTDYLDFHFGNYVFPTFNLADMLIVCGTILLALLILTDHSLLEDWPSNRTKEIAHGSDDTH